MYSPDRTYLSSEEKLRIIKDWEAEPLRLPRETALCEYLLDEEPQIRREALDVLWVRGSTRTVEAARNSLSDPDWSLRDLAAEILGECGDVSDLARLDPLLEDEEWVVRSTACTSYSTLGRDLAVPRLIFVLLQDESAEVRRYAAVALADTQAPGLANLLQTCLEEESDPQAVAGILNALIYLQRYEYLPMAIAYGREQGAIVRGILVHGLSSVLLHEPDLVGTVTSALQSWAVGDGLDAKAAAHALRLHSSFQNSFASRFALS